MISMRRIQAFLDCKEIDTKLIKRDFTTISDTSVTIKSQGNFHWGSQKEVDPEEEIKDILEARKLKEKPEKKPKKKSIKKSVWQTWKTFDRSEKFKFGNQKKESLFAS